MISLDSIVHPSFAVVVVLGRQGIHPQEVAPANRATNGVDESNLIGRKHFRSR